MTLEELSLLLESAKKREIATFYQIKFPIIAKILSKSVHDIPRKRSAN